MSWRIWIPALLVLFCVSGAARAQDVSPGTDQIVRACVKQMRKSVRLRSEYTYKILDETKDLSRSGEVKNTHLTLTEVMYFAGQAIRANAAERWQTAAGRRRET